MPEQTRVILDAIAALAKSIEDLRQDVSRIDATTRETNAKVQYIIDNFLGVDDHKQLQAGSNR